MYNIVVDSDALIKLAKSGLLQTIASRTHLLISERVYDEVVKKGKEKMYDDAITVERLVYEGIIRRVKEEGTESASGEHSSLNIFRQTNAAAIVSDDQRFLSFLESEGIPFIIPSHMIIRLVQRRKISAQTAISGLKRIRALIRNDAYQEAMNLIGGEDL